MDSLFGEGTSLPVRFFIAFVVVFALIGLTAWLIRRFGSGALGGQNSRGRVPRLAVIEAGAVDGRRKLVLIRRDNVEHLIMIGGPTDILVEANIVRGQSSRERASSVADNLSRVLAGATTDDSGWPPLQPEPAPIPRPAPVAARTAPLEDSSQWALQPDQAPPPALPKRARTADPLAGLAAELSVRPSEPVAAPVAHAPVPRPAPAMEAPRSAPRPAPMPMPTPAPAPAAAQQQSADQNLADMAQRLEAALRRPAPAAAPAPRPAAPMPAAPRAAAEAPRAAPPVTPPAPQVAPAKAPEVAPPSAPTAAQEKASEQPVPAKPAPIPAAPPAPAKAAPEKSEKSEKPDDPFGSLEEEMANLLGRSTSKPS